jgi:uncharacterized protein
MGSLVKNDSNSDINFTRSDLFIGVYQFVEQYMSRNDISHDFEHVLRVWNLAKSIAAEEQTISSQKPIDRDVVTIAALLHDVGDKKYIASVAEAELTIENLLKDLGCTHEYVIMIKTIVENVSYSNEIKHPESVQRVLNLYPELAIVQDADRLDAIGAVGIGRAFAYGAAKAPDRKLQGCVDHFTEKLENLRAMMKTNTGKRLADERTTRLKTFRSWWTEESSQLS